ncbi:3'-5' exonuclease [uncultured Ruminococcus sp.]|uniref:3'-5' exonuclease n=1 Tax=uncultured Ruminococcus sp. TaxID=165186 RepID=UPI0025F4885B|nr:3'-5' exonuclease [uncultured Ruminococcus sp.]
MPYINNLRENIASYENNSNALLTLSTIHSAKGMEFKNVIILDAYEGIIPKTPLDAIEENEDKKDLYQEERRLFYVAMTRAKDKLSIVRLSNENCSFVDELFGTERKELCPLRFSQGTRHKDTPPQFPFRSVLHSSPVITDTNIDDDIPASHLTEAVIDGITYKKGERVMHCYIVEGTIIAFTYIDGTEEILVHLLFCNKKDKFSLEDCVRKGIITKKK